MKINLLKHKLKTNITGKQGTGMTTFMKAMKSCDFSHIIEIRNELFLQKRLLKKG